MFERNASVAETATKETEMSLRGNGGAPPSRPGTRPRRFAASRLSTPSSSRAVGWRVTFLSF